jgi:hypothetical protein
MPQANRREAEAEKESGRCQDEMHQRYRQGDEGDNQAGSGNGSRPGQPGSQRQALNHDLRLGRWVSKAGERSCQGSSGHTVSLQSSGPSIQIALVALPSVRLVE